MQETFSVKGPYGKGLSLKPTGVHIAFAAGTGVLVFLDLVARIILHNSEIKPLPDFDDDFKFIFYLSH
jgi:NAD(P)H-flavin reductase